MSKLPEGWTSGSLGEVCEPSQYGYTAKAGASGNVHFLRTTDITSGPINWATVPYCDISVNDKEKYLLRDGDVVISRAGSVGFSCLIREPQPSIFASYLIRFKPRVDADYFNYFLQTPVYWNAISEQSLGIAVQNVNASKLSEIQIPLAPEAEQTRIVAKLEELLSDLDAGVAELKAAQKKLGQYRQSLLKAAVEGALTAEWRAQRQTPSPQPLPHQGGGALPPLSPRGRGAGGEGAHALSTSDEVWFRDRARQLRQEQTPMEQSLWQQLRAKRFSGFKFRRQQPIGRTIVDFVCFEQKLIIELDGSQHADAQAEDARRDHWLNEQGFRVLRFWNNEWQNQTDAVLETIWQALCVSPPLPNPSPARGEGLHTLLPLDGEGVGGEGVIGSVRETGAQLLARILTERRHRWETRQRAKFAEQGKPPPKDWQAKYPEPVQPDTTNLPLLPEGWVWSSIGQCFHVAVGATPSRKEPSYWNGDIPWVSSGEVQFTRVTRTKEQITADGLNNSSTHINPIGSVLLGMIGEGKTRGQVSILDIEAANNQNCAAIWVSETDIQSEYVYYWLWSQYDQTRRGSSGNNQPALNKSIVERIHFPLPPLEELKKIVSLVNASLEQVVDQEAAIKYAFKQSTAQRKNILKAAFAGQLVPQDPNDEPASALLARIRAERNARETSPKPRRRKILEVV